MKSFSNLLDKNSRRTTIFGSGLILWGIVNIIIDKIDFLVNHRYGCLIFFGPEPLLSRYSNIVFALAISFSGYLLLCKRKESVFFFIFAATAILLKYLFNYFISTPMTFGNFMFSSGLNFGLSIAGTIIFANEKLKNDIGNFTKRIFIKYILFLPISAVVIMFFGYESSIFSKPDKSEMWRQMISEAYPETDCNIDTCHFKSYFAEILNKDNVYDYSSIEIIQVDSKSDPIYSEMISEFDPEVISEYYIYDTLGRLIGKYKDDLIGNKDSTLYSYYNDSRLKTMTEILNQGFDTITSLYLYSDKIEKSDSFLKSNYDYVYYSVINNANQIISISQIKYIYKEGNVNYYYHPDGKIKQIERLSLRGNNSDSYENYFYTNERKVWLKETVEKRNGKLLSGKNKLVLILYSAPFKY